MFYTPKVNLTSVPTNSAARQNVSESVLPGSVMSGSVLPGSVLKISSILMCALVCIGGGSIGFAAELVNINVADVESIATALIGIGPAKAQAIVDYREEFGAFLQIQDITNVPGIGDVTLDQIKSLITIGNAVQ